MKKPVKLKKDNKRKSSKKLPISFGALLIFIAAGLLALYVVYKALFLPLFFAYSNPEPANMQDFKDFQSNSIKQDSKQAENVVTDLFNKIKNKDQKFAVKSSVNTCYQDDIQQGWTTKEYRKKCLIRDVFIVPLEINLKNETMSFNNKLKDLGVDSGHLKTLKPGCFHGRYDEFDGLDEGISIEAYIGLAKVKEDCGRFIPKQTPKLPLINKGVQYMYENYFNENAVRQQSQNSSPYLMRVAIQKIYFNEKIK